MIPFCYNHQFFYFCCLFAVIRCYTSQHKANIWNSIHTMPNNSHKIQNIENIHPHNTKSTFTQYIIYIHTILNNIHTIQDNIHTIQHIYTFDVFTSHAVITGKLTTITECVRCCKTSNNNYLIFYACSRASDIDCIF